MGGHIVLLGDSIFDNASYVPGGPSVLDHLQRILPSDWQATLVAVDGATIASVEGQLQRVPRDATHLVLSVGGNDALEYAGFILSQLADSYAMALAGIARIRDEFAVEYREMLSNVQLRQLPLFVCTIYEAIPDLGAAESAGLSVFNEAITKEVFAAGVALIDLRIICNEPTDYATISPIEPSATGGGKIARAIHSAIFRPNDGPRVTTR